MAGTIRGSIEHFLNGAGVGSGSVQFMFINIYNFLNNNTGTLGIQRLAYNTGSQNTGMTQFRGMNYFDQANPAGDNAFAVFRFSSASNPFEVLVQWAGSSNAFGTAPGSPGLVNAAAGTNTVGFAFAQSISGSICWNGTTASNGNDRKGTPVWVSSSNIAYHPRSNDLTRAGTHGSSKQNAMGPGATTGVDVRMHCIADYDNFVVLWDASADNTYAGMIFGKYAAMGGLSVDLPYFSFVSNPLPATAGTVYGPLAGGTEGGGASFPTLSSSGTISITFDRIGTVFMQSTTNQPNKMFATQRFDEFPIFLGGGESPNQLGLLGQHYEFVREVYNIAAHDTNADGTRAVFGGSTTLAAIKLTVPWHSGTSPGSGATRTGVQFGI